MITDDPETPGNGKWEINLAGTWERTSGENLFEIPALDLNYGVGDHIQLKLEGSWLVRHRNGGTTEDGGGDALAGVKWRFLDQESNGVSMSIYPQIEWNLSSSSVHRGLIERGTHFILPAEISRKVGPFELDAEAGYVVGINTGDEWLFGILAAYPISEKFEIMAELHSDLPSDFGSSQLTANLGTRFKLTEHVTILASVGHDFLSEAGERRNVISYVGFQFTF